MQLEKRPLPPLSSYEKWALDFFANSEDVHNPNLSLTLQVDITGVEEHYNDNYKNANSSFTSYLIYTLLKSIQEVPPFSYRRCIETNTWYQYRGMPLIFPVALETENRFAEVFMENPMEKSWEEFSREYREKIVEVKKNGHQRQAIDKETWLFSHFIGNLPYLQFSSLHLHSCYPFVGKPSFYFGKRYELLKQRFIPLAIGIDHANTDPYLVNTLLQIYSKNLFR